MRKYIAYDCESGGLNPQQYSLLTVCFKVADSSLQVIETLNLSLKPNDGVYKIHPKALEKNKIDIVKHDREAITYKEAKSKVLTFLSRHSGLGAEKLTPIGFNVGFDDGFIQSQLVPKEDWEMHVDYHKLDVSVAFQLLKFFNLVPGSVKSNLTSVAHAFGCLGENAHTAEADTEMTINVLRNMKQRFITKKDVK